jgi:hypothetical protein
MERSSDSDKLGTALAEARPTPRIAFTQELDERVAAGFPRRSRFDDTALSGIVEWIRMLSPQRLLFAGGTAALAAIAIATVIATSSDSGSKTIALDSGSATTPDPSVQYSDAIPRAAEPESAGTAGIAGDSSEVQSSSAAGVSGPSRSFGEAENKSLSPQSLSPDIERSPRNREIERSAQISLLAPPADVADDSTKVFAAVHDAGGIVLHSTTSSGSDAGARFALLIPSARLGDALAAISSIDEVSSRHEATDDITAPTVSAREELRDSRARIDTLLNQLAAAETETEAEAVELELRGERRHAARLRARLANLDRRTTYSRVSVEIESGASADSNGAWGFDDAIGDAGRILAIAAAVTLVGLAIAAPIALIALLAWLAHRLWRRAGRERALDA